MGTVSVHWKEHGDVFLKGIADYFMNGCLADTNVTYGSDILRVHRLILAVFLPTFKRSLDVATDDPLMALNFDCVADSIEDVRALVRFIYTGSMTVAESRVDHLRQLAEDLCFPGLAEALATVDHHSVLKSESQPDTIGVDMCDVIVKTEMRDIDMDDWPASDSAIRNDDFTAGRDGNHYAQSADDISTGSSRALRTPEAIRTPAKRRRSRNRTFISPCSIGGDTWPGILRCETCDIEFDSQMDLKIHFRCSHPHDKMHACKQCGFLTVSETEFLAHMTSRHPSSATSKRFHCDLCNSTFTERHFLTHHVLTVHENVRPYKCPQCTNKSFKSHSALRLHAVKNHGQKPLGHPSHHYDQQRHQQQMVVQSIHDMFWCDKCDAGFDKNTTLARHILAVHDDKEEGDGGGNSVDDCDDDNYLDDLEDESYLPPLRRRLGIGVAGTINAGSNGSGRPTTRSASARPTTHGCDRCSKTFKSAFTLKLHLRSKHGDPAEQQHKCTVCGKGYSIVYLAEHMARIHNIMLDTTVGERMGLTNTRPRTVSRVRKGLSGHRRKIRPIRDEKTCSKLGSTSPIPSPQPPQ